jgi:Arc/MetJ-type ribon-helix-helix transcriptional regulator
MANFGIEYRLAQVFDQATRDDGYGPTRPVLLRWNAGGTPLSIHCPHDIEISIRRRVQRRQFPDEGEVVCAAVHRLDERESQLETLRAKSRVGLDQLDRGERIDMTPEA